MAKRRKKQYIIICTKCGHVHLIEIHGKRALFVSSGAYNG